MKLVAIELSQELPDLMRAEDLLGERRRELQERVPQGFLSLLRSLDPRAFELPIVLLFRERLEQRHGFEPALFVCLLASTERGVFIGERLQELLTCVAVQRENLLGVPLCTLQRRAERGHELLKGLVLVAVEGRFVKLGTVVVCAAITLNRLEEPFALALVEIRRRDTEMPDGLDAR